MARATLRSLSPDALRGRTVLVRADFNVPLDGSAVSDDTRIRRTLPTVRILTDAGARTVLMSHLGRPGGAPDPELSLEPVARRLAELLEGEVRFVPETAGDAVDRAVEAMRDGDVLLLENTRFEPGEKENDPGLARAWARHADLYVNDAFGAAHRAHASTAAVADAVRTAGGRAVAGTLMEEELRILDGALSDPERPFHGVLGGAKISGKIDVIRALLPRVDRLVVGGAMANTFFRALGLETGASLVEEDRIEVARELLEEAGDTLVLPVDCVVAPEVVEGAPFRVVERSAVEDDDRIVDVGPASRTLFRRTLLGARTVFWNGPMGVFEIDAFAAGTEAVARTVADVADAGALTVVGGGDSVAAAGKAGVIDRIGHVSTGGGASLELLAGNALPGVEALDEAS